MEESEGLPYGRLGEGTSSKRSGRGCLLGLFSRRWRKSAAPDLLATITHLGNIMRDLELQKKRLWGEMSKKKAAASKYWGQGRKWEAREALKTAKMYDVTYRSWVMMKENVERLKHQVTTQNQNARVAQGFKHANDVMADLLSKVDIHTLETMMAEVEGRISEGEDVTQALSRPLDTGEVWDDDDLDRELEVLCDNVEPGGPEAQAKSVPESNHEVQRPSASVPAHPGSSRSVVENQSARGTRKGAALV